MIIDTSHWQRDFKSQASGTRKKFWLYEPNQNKEYTTMHLFKMPTEGTGGHWAEYIASKIGIVLGFRTAKVKLATNEGAMGTISENFRLKTEEFYEGGDLFQARFTDFDRYSLSHYNINNILQLLSVYDLAEGFISIPIFDALIANNDRHCDNWGVLDSLDGTRLAPIYDNGSSLGFNEVADKKKKMLHDERMLKGFCNRGKPSIGLSDKERPKHLELLSYLYKEYPLEVTNNFRRLKRLNEGMIKSIVENIPRCAINDLNKEWVIHLLIYRKEWLLNWYEGL